MDLWVIFRSLSGWVLTPVRVSGVKAFRNQLMMSRTFIPNLEMYPLLQ
jgi:hypothetical protein